MVCLLSIGQGVLRGSMGSVHSNLCLSFPETFSSYALQDWDQSILLILTAPGWLRRIWYTETPDMLHGLQIVQIFLSGTELLSCFIGTGFNGKAVKAQILRDILSLSFLLCQKQGWLFAIMSIIGHGRHTSLGVSLGSSTLTISSWDRCSVSCCWFWISVCLSTLSRTRFMPFLFFQRPWTSHLRPLYRESPMLLPSPCTFPCHSVMVWFVLRIRNHCLSSLETLVSIHIQGGVPCSHHLYKTNVLTSGFTLQKTLFGFAQGQSGVKVQDYLLAYGNFRLLPQPGHCFSVQLYFAKKKFHSIVWMWFGLCKHVCQPLLLSGRLILFCKAR